MVFFDYNMEYFAVFSFCLTIVLNYDTIIVQHIFYYFILRVTL